MSWMFFESMIGSHAWSMNRPCTTCGSFEHHPPTHETYGGSYDVVENGGHVYDGSDVDLWRVYVCDTPDLLLGNPSLKATQTHSSTIDVTTYEVGHAIREIKKMNPNFVCGILSPKPVTETLWSTQLRQIVRDNLSQQIFKPINGMVTGNWHKYIATEKDTGQKRCSQLVRFLQFGIEILQGSQPSFRPVRLDACDPDFVEHHWEVFRNVLEASPLPEKTDHEPFDEFLLKLRTSECFKWLQSIGRIPEI